MFSEDQGGAETPFIFGDWGTTAMWLALCRIVDGRLEEIDTARGKGIKFTADPEQTFFDAAQGWFDRHGKLPVTLAGMVGSNRGWKETAYVECAAAAGDLAQAALRFEARGVPFSILPGLGCTNIFGFPDIMRGEETQIFGWLGHMGAGKGRHLVCLPGTHAKWALVEDGSVRHFFTSMQGEVFDILMKHSLLGADLPEETQAPPVAPHDAGFRRGLELIAADPALAAGHAIFAARSLRVRGALAAGDVAAFLSGMLIAADTRDALRALQSRGETFETLSFVGSSTLISLYAAAAERFGWNAGQLDAAPAMRAAARFLHPALHPARLSPRP